MACHAQHDRSVDHSRDGEGSVGRRVRASDRPQEDELRCLEQAVIDLERPARGGLLKDLGSARCGKQFGTLDGVPFHGSYASESASSMIEITANVGSAASKLELNSSTATSAPFPLGV